MRERKIPRFYDRRNEVQTEKEGQVSSGNPISPIGENDGPSGRYGDISEQEQKVQGIYNDPNQTGGLYGNNQAGSPYMPYPAGQQFSGTSIRYSSSNSSYYDNNQPRPLAVTIMQSVSGLIFAGIFFFMGSLVGEAENSTMTVNGQVIDNDSPLAEKMTFAWQYGIPGVIVLLFVILPLVRHFLLSRSK